MLRRTLFKIARSPAAGAFIGFSFAHLTPLMPLDKVLNGPKAIVFTHPVPTWKTHILGVPKMRLPSFAMLDLGEERTQEAILAVYAGLRETAVSLQLNSFSIVVNGGAYQDVPQVHFHLLSGISKRGIMPGLETVEKMGKETAVIKHNQAIAYPHPNSPNKFHYLITTKPPAPSFQEIDFRQANAQYHFLDLLSLAQKVITQQQPPAYRFQLNYNAKKTNSPLTFHLIQ